MKKVDVAINVYGKPFQTAVSLLSLLRHSGQHIDKIYFILEPKQPRSREQQFIIKMLGDRLSLHIPKHWFWIHPAKIEELGDDDYRQSLRYQFAFEKSTADNLYLTHNDVLYSGDIIGEMMSKIGDSTGIGPIGQCWNCPASAAKLCDSDNYENFRPDYEEILELESRFPTPRMVDYRDWLNPERPWPLPECRLNEWCALIDLKKARQMTMPIGSALPFGLMAMDIGSLWFSDIVTLGGHFKNMGIEKFASHGWADELFGHPSLFDADQYERSERVARDLLISDFGLKSSEMPGIRTVRRSMTDRIREFLRNRSKA